MVVFGRTCRCILLLTLGFSADALSANDPNWMEVPEDIQILRLPWVSKSMVHALCAERYPALVARYSHTIPVHQAEVRRAEAMLGKDVLDRGLDGQRYLDAYLKVTQALLDQMIKDAASAPPPTEQECLPVVSTSAKAENLFQMWSFFVRQMQENASTAPRAQKRTH